MGYDINIIDMIGFSCTSKNGKLLLLNVALEEEDIDIEDELGKDFSEFRDVFEQIKNMGVISAMYEPVIGTEPMAIGWLADQVRVPTEDEVQKLGKILKKFGLNPVRLKKDRFACYS